MTRELKFKFLFFAIIIIGMGFLYFRKEYITINGNYTLAHLYKIHKIRGGRVNKYHYVVNGKKYEIHYSTIGESPKLLFCQFLPSHPSASVLLIYDTVPYCFNTLQKSPPWGWKQKPFCD